LEHDVVLELVNGQMREVTLARPFNPTESKIHVFMGTNGDARKFSLSNVCCVLMKNIPDEIALSQEDGVLEEVETINGNYYFVLVIEKKKNQAGFYGLNSDSSNPYKLIFFTFHGLRSRRQEASLGEILGQKGLISDSEVAEALSEQQRLKSRRIGEIIAESQNLKQEVIENAIQQAHKTGKVPPRARVGEILIDAGLITKKQLEDALASQKSGKRKKIGTLLIERKFVTESQILSALATKFKMRFVDLEDIVPNARALTALPIGMIDRLQVFPIDDNDGRLVVATSRPTDTSIGDVLRFYLGRRVELAVATAEQIKKAIEKYYAKYKDILEDLIDEMPEDDIAVEEDLDDFAVDETDSQIIKLVNKILLDGYQRGVSDIHLEPGPAGQPLQERHRIDGSCESTHKIPRSFNKAIISRIKILSNLDISERRRPQSGKIIVSYKNKKIEYRVEITPTIGGNEDAVIRVLTASTPFALKDMGFSPSNLKGIEEILSKPYGLILCVGPTGSGKSTTLHSALKHISTPALKIWTVEDPVEITQDGLRQVQVHQAIGFTFQEALRSFLRADPDVIMVGEMRDLETAKIGIEASLTGHLVLSTLHTNSATETVVRLIEMGLDPLSFSDSLLGVLAQRLARKLCEKCKKTYHPDIEEYDEIVDAYNSELFKAHNMPTYNDNFSLMKEGECGECYGIGYKGRIAIHELLLGTEGVKKAIKQRLMVEEIFALAMQEGMKTLKMDGIQKVFQGITDLSQILKVCL